MRYTASFKLSVVQKYAANEDISTLRTQHGISHDELMSWVKHFMSRGRSGLKATHVQAVCKQERRNV